MSRSTTAARRQCHPRRGRRGFTLLEIIVVVTIIALLATLVAPKLLGNIGKAKQRAATSDVASIYQQVNIWMADHGISRLPGDFRLDTLARGDDRLLNSDDLIDPWDNAYVLVNPGEVNPDFDIVSYGADGVPGGEGEDADVVN
ncbi:MAG: prepilin-type N-terminal cleavage/methylation domain-containing protein [Phycisphaerales bacterium]|nr:type II secretion system protein GspG [Phycisphaerae bacterium]NNF44517.1 prepilin-type N-terminal cleavage/methylation domain-containing protein [Phycisphaerales bacterium]NNM24406.1 prepilin-type N-terminal cleavage/methylation domain-containing protein [Phycisphaerales bacterium]